MGQSVIAFSLVGDHQEYNGGTFSTEIGTSQAVASGFKSFQAGLLLTFRPNHYTDHCLVVAFRSTKSGI